MNPTFCLHIWKKRSNMSETLPDKFICPEIALKLYHWAFSALMQMNVYSSEDGSQWFSAWTIMWQRWKQIQNTSTAHSKKMTLRHLSNAPQQWDLDYQKDIQAQSYVVSGILNS